MSATSQNLEKFHNYEGFVEKFKPKKTPEGENNSGGSLLLSERAAAESREAQKG